MKFQVLLKTILMLGLVIAGRLARDAEQTNPGRSISEILKAPATARVAPPAVSRPRPLPPTPAALPRPLTAPQTASFADLD